MKQFKVIILALLLISFYSLSFAGDGAIVIKDGSAALTVGGETVISDEYMRVVTPQGNVLIKVVWHLSLDNPVVPEKGVNKIGIGGQGVIDAETLVFSDGKVKLVGHINGSGNVTPNPGNKK